MIYKANANERSCSFTIYSSQSNPRIQSFYMLVHSVFHYLTYHLRLSQLWIPSTTILSFPMTMHTQQQSGAEVDARKARMGNLATYFDIRTVSKHRFAGINGVESVGSQLFSLSRWRAGLIPSEYHSRLGEETSPRKYESYVFIFGVLFIGRCVCGCYIIVTVNIVHLFS